MTGAERRAAVKEVQSDPCMAKIKAAGEVRREETLEEEEGEPCLAYQSGMKTSSDDNATAGVSIKVSMLKI